MPLFREDAGITITGRSNMETKEWYGLIGLLVGFISFLFILMYALIEWGFLLGLVFGWIPALIGGVLAGIFWPIIVIIFGLMLFQGVL